MAQYIPRRLVRSSHNYQVIGTSLFVTLSRISSRILFKSHSKIYIPTCGLLPLMIWFYKTKTFILQRQVMISRNKIWQSIVLILVQQSNALRVDRGSSFDLD